MRLAQFLDWLCGIFASSAQDECILNQLIARNRSSSEH